MNALTYMRYMRFDGNLCMNLYGIYSVKDNRLIAIQNIDASYFELVPSC